MREEEMAGAFFLEDGGLGQFVGIFLDEPPNAPGLHPFEVWRSGGNYNMSTALRAGAKPRAYYLRPSGRRRYFTIEDLPEYGLLHLSNFANEP